MEVNEATTEEVYPKKEDDPLLPEMTLYRLDLEKIISKGGRKFDAAINDEKFGYGKSLCEDIIDIYNNADCDTPPAGGGADNEQAQQQNVEGSSEVDNIEFDSLTIQEGDKYVKFENDRDYTDVSVVGYKQCKSTKNELMEALSKVFSFSGECESRTVSVILFVIMGSEESPSIYALTKNYAHFVVRDICDNNFSFKIAECNIDPKINSMEKRHLVGKSYTSSCMYRYATIPTHMSGNDLVDKIKSRFKDESKILKENQSLQLREKGARLNVTRKAVHICRKQSLKQFVSVIQHMDKLLKDRKEEGTEELAYLDYIKLVEDQATKKELEDHLIKMIWQDIEKRRGLEKLENSPQEPRQMTHESQHDSGFCPNNSLPTQTDQQSVQKPMGANKHGYIDFCYRNYKKYYSGHSFRFVRPGRKGPQVMWEEPKSYEEVLEDLDTAFADKTTLDSFSEEIKEKKLQFTVEDPDAEKQHEMKDLLLNFFQAECQLHGQSYFKINAEWLMVDLQYIYQVHKDFQNLLKFKFKDEKSIVHLPEIWQWNWYNKEKFRESHIKEITQLKKEDVKKIWQWLKEMSLVTKSREVKKSDLQRVFPTENTMKYVYDFLAKIEGKSDPAYQRSTDFQKSEFSNIANVVEEVTDNTWEELKQCSIVKKDKLRLTKLKECIQQINHIKQFLSETEGMTEGAYNESYSFLDSEKHENVCMDVPRWFVGDRILHDGIEVFDLMQVAENGEDLFLYHVKESFGQKTRDACSQIKVSANALRTSINSMSDDFLEKFYETIVGYDGKKYEYRINERIKVERLGKEGFIDLFMNRRITYVYAFVDTHKEEAKLIKEVNRKIQKSEMGDDEKTETANTETDYDTNIARVELLALNQVVEGLGFQLAICQINRHDDAVDSKDQKPYFRQDSGIDRSPAKKKLKLDG